MKKKLAILLVLVMLFALLAACDKTAGDSKESPSSETPSSPADVKFPGEIGMYSPDYDYNANPRYKVTYIVSNNTSGLYTATGEAFKHWASLMNVDFKGMIDFANDNDALFSQLPQLARDNDGLLFDADSTMYDRVYDVMKEAGKPWMSFMAAPRDYSNDATPLLIPFAGFEQYDVGAMYADYLLDKAAKEWPNVPIEEFGAICVDFSNAPPLHEREMGFYDRLKELNPDMANNRYWVADTAINFFDADTSQQVVNTVLSMQPQIKYWIVFAEIDDMAQGAAAALGLMGLADNSYVSAFGGTALQQQWDTKLQTAWKSAFYLPQTIFTEPAFCGLYAFMNGDATPESLWPQWKNVNEDTSYGAFASRMLPFYEILFDNYKHMIKWSDIYAGSNLYPDYPLGDITRDSYSTTVPVPDFYKVKQ